LPAGGSEAFPKVGKTVNTVLAFHKFWETLTMPRLLQSVPKYRTAGDSVTMRLAVLLYATIPPMFLQA
jgi:hypothetical protein